MIWEHSWSHPDLKENTLEVSPVNGKFAMRFSYVKFVMLLNFIFNVSLLKGILKVINRFWNLCKTFPESVKITTFSFLFYRTIFAFLLQTPIFNSFCLVILFLVLWLILCWLFTATWASSSCSEWSPLSSCGVQASHCSGFSCCRARTLGHVGFSSRGSWLSSCHSRALEHRLNNCGTWA